MLLPTQLYTNGYLALAGGPKLMLTGQMHVSLYMVYIQVGPQYPNKICHEVCPVWYSTCILMSLNGYFCCSFLIFTNAQPGWSAVNQKSCIFEMPFNDVWMVVSELTIKKTTCNHVFIQVASAITLPNHLQLWMANSSKLLNNYYLQAMSWILPTLTLW